MRKGQPDLERTIKRGLASLGVMGGLFSGGSMPGVPPAAQAADSAKVGTCLLQSCQKELAACPCEMCFPNSWDRSRWATLNALPTLGW